MLESAVVGPNVSVADGSVIRRTRVANSIIGAESVLEDCELEQSLIGDHVRARGLRGTASLGDHSEIDGASEVTARRIGALTVIFCGLALGFSGLQLRSHSGEGRRRRSLVRADSFSSGSESSCFRVPSGRRVAGWIPGSKAADTEEPPSAE